MSCLTTPDVVFYTFNIRLSRNTTEREALKMEFHELFPTQIKMNGLEEMFQKLWLEHPEMNLNFPHPQEYYSDILKLVADRSGDPFPSRLLDTKLDEPSFFHENADTELYRHVRYLPAILHFHSFLEIVCVMEGSCTNYVGSQELHMKKGDICIIAPETEHAISAFSDGCILINILLRVSTFETAFFGVLSENDILSDFFTRTLYHSKSHPYLYFRTGADQEVFDFILYAYQEFLGNRQYKERFLNNIISAFFIMLLRNHGSDVIVPEIATEGNDENVVFLLKYMQENYSTVTLSGLAEFFNYSERQIQRIIKKSTGSSFSENIQKLKMKHAAQLLMDPDRPVSSIADELGYSDVGNFRNVFRKFYGMSPAEYRSRPESRNSIM